MTDSYDIENEEKFMQHLFAFHKTNGIPDIKIPKIGGKDLDLFLLYKLVTKKGGGEKVTEKRLWKDIVKMFKLPQSCTSASFTLKKHYQKYLLAYEQKYFFKKNAGEAIQKLEDRRKKIGRENRSFPKYLELDEKLIEPFYENAQEDRDDLSEQPFGQAYNNDGNYNSFGMNFNNQSNYEARPPITNFDHNKVVQTLLQHDSEDIDNQFEKLLDKSLDRHNPIYMDKNLNLFNAIESFFFYLLNIINEKKFNLNTKQEQEGTDQNQDCGDIENPSQSHLFNLTIERLHKVLRFLINIVSRVEENRMFMKQFHDFKVCLIDIYIKMDESNLKTDSLELLGYLLTADELDLNENKHFVMKRIDSSLREGEMNERRQAIFFLQNIFGPENHGLLTDNFGYYILQLVQLLLSNSYALVLDILYLFDSFTEWDVNSRAYVAGEKFIFSRLIALMTHNIGNKDESMKNVCIKLITKLLVVHENYEEVKLFEDDLFMIASMYKSM